MFCNSLEMGKITIVLGAILLPFLIAAGCCKSKSSSSKPSSTSKPTQPKSVPQWVYNIDRVSNAPTAVKPTGVDKNGDKSVIYSYRNEDIGVPDGFMTSLGVLKSNKDAWVFIVNDSKRIAVSDFGETEFITLGGGPRNRWFKIKSGPLAGKYVEKVELVGDSGSNWFVVNKAFACNPNNSLGRRLECCGH